VTAFEPVCMNNQLLIPPFVQSPSHAMYLGMELQKAEVAVRLGRDYQQDQSLWR